MEDSRLDEIEGNLDALQSTMGNGTKLTLQRFVDRATDFVFEDSADLLAEVRRLRKIEAALIDAKKWKRTQEAVLKTTAKEDRMIWQVESAHENEREARMLGESAEELERILEGKGIA